jgi:hypothetical protein
LDLRLLVDGVDRGRADLIEKIRDLVGLCLSPPVWSRF